MSEISLRKKEKYFTVNDFSRIILIEIFDKCIEKSRFKRLIFLARIPSN